MPIQPTPNSPPPTSATPPTNPSLPPPPPYPQPPTTTTPLPPPPPLPDLTPAPEASVVREPNHNYNIADFYAMMAHCITKTASDLHLRANHLPKARINLNVSPLPEFHRPTTEQDLSQLYKHLIDLNALTAGAARDHFDKEGWCDFSFQFQGSATRGSCFLDTQGTCLVLRFFYAQFVSLSAIGMTHVVPHLAKQAGLILLTGPTGSGKTTLASAMLEHINTNDNVHIASIEDPVEFPLVERVARITQRAVPTHVRSFNAGLRSILRQDPDVVFVGEVRDRDVLETAISAAESGHIVISTLHASSVVDTFNRIINMFPADKERQIRNSLASMHVMIVNQRLLRGSQGKTLAHELFYNADQTRATIRNGDINTLTDTTLTVKDMVHWDRRLGQLLVSAKIDQNTWESNVRDHDSAKRILQQLRTGR